MAAGLRALPAGRFTAKRDLERYVGDYNFAPPRHGRLTSGRIPGEIVYVPAR